MSRNSTFSLATATGHSLHPHACGAAGAGASGPCLVYFVNDSPSLGVEVESTLGGAGVAVQACASLRAIAAQPVNSRLIAILVELKVLLDTDNAAAVLTEIHARHGAGLPVVVISAEDGLESRLAGMRAGGTHFFRRPLDRRMLRYFLAELAQQQREAAYRILLVEDDNIQADAICLALRHGGMEVQHVDNAFAALEAMDDFAPEAILMDIYMPSCSGIELAAVIRQHEKYTGVPIAYLSVESDARKQQSALGAGADDFISKSVSAHELVEKVEVRARRGRALAREAAVIRSAFRELENQQIALDMHSIVSVSDVDGNIIYVNDKFCEISKYNAAELIGQNHRIVNSGYHPPEFFTDMWRTIQSGKVWNGVIRNRAKDGSDYWVESTIVPFLDGDGRPYQYVSVRTDVTVLKQALRDNEISEERLRHSQSFANIGTWDWNIQTGDLYWSDRIGPLFGYGVGELETTYENFIGALHPDDRQMVANAVNACVQDGAEYDIEHRLVWPDGTVRWAHERGNVVRDADGRPLRMLGVVQDITRRKLAEDQIILAREDAERANLAKSQFLSSMSHELRTPLNAILGFAQILEADATEPLSPDQVESVDQILKAGWHLLELINEVLDLAKIEAGRVQLSMENVDIRALIGECRDLILPMARLHSVVLRDESEACNGAFVHADRTRLKQVILNLLSNAVKYNRDGGSVSIRCASMADGTARLSVVDTGHGISAEQQVHLFEPFNRLGRENEAVEGVGIGLVITRRLVDLMGGELEVSSQVGVGSTFTVVLAAAVSVAQVAADDGLRDNATAGTPLAGGRRTVLYVEDNPVNLKLVKQILAPQRDITLLTAHTGELGLDLARAHSPDLVVLDLNLPGMDGLQVLKQLRRDTRTSHIPAIALSANASPHDIERAISVGFCEYITKPINVKKFIAAIYHHLENREVNRP